MGYYLRAIIAGRQVLEPHASDYQFAAMVSLAENMALIPATDELLDEIGMGVAQGHFAQLHQALADWMIVISASDKAAYVEAEFLGGSGSQNAAVWFHGKQTFASCRSKQAINEALHLLGVHCGKHRDEFEAVGLDRHRDISDWLADATLKASKHLEK